MNKTTKDLLRHLIDEARELCTQGCYRKSARNCLIDVGALLIEMRQLVENEVSTEAGCYDGRN